MINAYWTALDTDPWEQVRQVLQHAADTWLQRYSPDKDVVVYTDASNRFWSIILTQPDAAGIIKPLSFLSQKYTGLHGQWSINDKEAFPIVFAI